MKPIQREELNTMRCFAIVSTAILLGVIGAVLPASAQAQKPNILVIWGDDIGISNISACDLALMRNRTNQSTFSAEKQQRDR